MKAINNHFELLLSPSEKEAAGICAGILSDWLTAALASNSTVRFFVSGGQSPAPVFELLSLHKLRWNNIDIHLVDERWALDNTSDQNQTLVEARLLRNLALPALFNPLLLTTEFDTNLAICNEAVADIPAPDIVLLGMGLDGHTASLFPDSDDYAKAMATADRYVGVQPRSAPYQRISMSYRWLSSAKQIVLYIPGQEKLAAFRHYIQHDDKLTPVSALVHAAAARLTVIATGSK